MAPRYPREGLSLLYRLGWRFRVGAMHIFGPAQLGTQDPQERLIRERERKSAAAVAKRAGTTAPTGSPADPPRTS